MGIDEQEIRRFFSVGDIVGSGGNRSKFMVSRISDQFVYIQPIKAKTGSRLRFDKLSVVADSFEAIDKSCIEHSVGAILNHHSLQDNTNETYLYGFAREYLRRKSRNLTSQVTITKIGTVRDTPPNLVTGQPRYEIWFNLKDRDGIPSVSGSRVPIDLVMGTRMFKAGIRESPATPYIWICPDLKDGAGNSLPLSQVLQEEGYTKNDQIKITFDGTRATVTDSRPGVAYWAFLANPKYYKIEEAVKNLPIDYWSVGDSDVKRGDKCIIWKAKGASDYRGVVAIGDILTDPQVMEEQQESLEYWLEEDDRKAVRRVQVRYSVPMTLPIWLEDDKSGTLALLSVGRATGGSVFKITDEQWCSLTKLIDTPTYSGANFLQVLFKTVGNSQHRDGVRIDQNFHHIFNPPYSPYFCPKGTSRAITVEFNGKKFESKYVFEGTRVSDRDLQRIQFSSALREEFVSVFPTASGFFSIRLGHDLNSFLFSHDSQDFNDYTAKLEEEITRSKRDSRKARLKRLANAPVVPGSVQVTSVAFIRNPDVIVEVLERSAGVCERCTNSAPFFRKKDGSPYLEVHHKVPLSEGGKDTVDNAIAVCPNCHRELHYG